MTTRSGGARARSTASPWGADTVIGAGAVMVQDVPDRVVAYGAPVLVARSREPGEVHL
jgi:acetyltransferase-like isoleucine patch superfamily enzyme